MILISKSQCLSVWITGQLRNRLGLSVSTYSKSVSSEEVRMLLGSSAHTAKNSYSYCIEKAGRKDRRFNFIFFNSYSKLSLKIVNLGYYVLFG